ncbi:MAG: hypothetical protein WEB53_10420 [Akkermansiaceae bacterium]
MEGAHSGSDLTHVKANNLAAIASLQHRLDTLDPTARIVMDCLLFVR